MERENFNRDFRERDKTWENKVKVGYVNRALADTTLRLSFENDNKRGSEYNYRSFYLYGQGLPGLTLGDILNPALGNPSADGATIYGLTKTTTYLAGLMNQQSSYFRKLDEADRDQQILNGRLNIAALDDLDIGVFAQVKRVKYPNSTYGVQSNNQNSLSVDANYQASATQSITAYVSYQQAVRKLNGNTGTGTATCTLAQAQYALASGDYSACTDSNRPATADWSNETKDVNNVIGATFQNDFGSYRLIVDYSFSSSRTSTTNTFGSTAISATGATQTAAATVIAANAMPDMTFRQQNLNVNLLVPMDKNTTIRLYDSFAVGRVADWHYDNVIHNAVAAYDSGTLMLDSGAMNYHVNTVGVFLNYKM